MEKKIKLIKSHFLNQNETIENLIKFISKAPKLSMGDECKKFESSFSAFHKRKFSSMVSNGSSANLGLLQSLINMGKLNVGDKIAFSAVTWSTNVMPIIQLGFDPIAIDAELNTLNISSNKLKNILIQHPDIKALFITNILGLSSDIDEILNVCNEENILLIEDNCESLGSEFKKKKLGNFGIASTCSFFVGHHLSTIEGGIITTDDEELYQMTQLVRAHGWNRDLDDKKKKKLTSEYGIDSFQDAYTFYELALNIRPTEISGFIGNQQIPLLEDSIMIRQQNYHRFRDILSINDNFYDIYNLHLNVVSNMAFPVLAKSKDIFYDTKKIFESEGVEIRPIVAGNMIKQPFYRKLFPNKENNLSNANIIHENGFYFPNNPELTLGELDLLSNLLNSL